MREGVHERRCICGHDDATHVFCHDGSICAFDGCKCINFHLWEVTLRDPTGVPHKVTDVRKFIRDNPQMFEEIDLVKKYKSVQKTRGAKDYWTTAEGGIYSLLSARQEESWKGWTVMTFPKTFRP